MRSKTHWPTPVPRSYAETFNSGVIPGFQKFSARYGLMMDHFATEFPHGFGYVRIRAVGEPEKGGGPPPRPITWLFARLHPRLRARTKAAERALEERLWLEDLSRWEHQVLPRTVEANRRLQTVELGALGDDALREHLRRCRENLERMHGVHHEFNGPALVPLGLLMELLDEAGGLGDRAGDLMQGASPLSSGRSDRLDRLAVAIRGDAELMRLVEADANLSLIHI